MGKTNKKFAFIVAAVAAAVMLVAALFAAGRTHTALADTGGSIATAYTVTHLTAEYEISDDGYVYVTETAEITYTGSQSANIVRYLPCGDGQRTRHVSAAVMRDDGTFGTVEYSVSTDNGRLLITVDDEVSKSNESYTYRITYEYYDVDAEDGVIELSAADGWNAVVTETRVRVTLPSSVQSKNILIDGSAVENYQTDGNTISFSYGGALSVTLMLDGATLTGEYAGYYALIASAALLVAAVAIKLIFFNKHKLKKDSGLKAVGDMDPLLMGKLIDNKAHDCDIASLIFYWANRGFVRIDMSDVQKPVVIKLKNLPAMAPEYEQILFYRIFRHRSVVRVGVTGGKGYYKTAEAVKKSVDEKARGSYSSKGIGCSILFALLGGLTLGLYPCLYAAFLISHTYAYLTGFVWLLPALLVYGLAETLLYNRFRFSRGIKALYCLGIIAICCASTVAYAFLVPDFVLELAPKILICLLGFATVICSTMLISRTERYNTQLSEILGFRQFILTATEPDVRDMMKETPDIFFMLYPYAIVLNLDDVWASRFSSTRMKAPAWCEMSGKELPGSGPIYAKMRAVCGKFMSTLVSRPVEETENKRQS